METISTRTVQCLCGAERQVDEVYSGYALMFVYRDRYECPACRHYHKPGELVQWQSDIKAGIIRCKVGPD